MKTQDALIFGRHPLLEALKAGRGFEKIMMLKESRSNELKEINKLARDKGIQVQFVPVQKLNTYTRKNHQGVIGLASLIPYYDIQDVLMQVYDNGQIPLFLLLDQVTDVRNFGAIARTAECLGVNAIILPAKGSATINAEAMKASAGALHNIAVCKVNSLKDAIDLLKLNGIKTMAADIETENLLPKVDLTGPIALILGSEGDGVSNAVLKQVDEVFTIPMIGKTESLNVSVSAGMVLYEAIRQRSADTNA